MKLSQLKTIVKEAVKEAIQEEMKDILMEAVRSPKQTVIETKSPSPSTGVGTPGPMNPIAQTPMHEDKRMEMRENIQGILGSMMPGADGTLSANSSNVQPLQMGGNVDTTSPNGQLPGGEVSMDMINNIMKGKI